MRQPKWDKHSIKAEIHRRGMTLTRLAELNDLSPGRFRAVWARTDRKVEAAIAAFLDLPAEELFPDRYPITSARILDTKRYGPSASQKSATAADQASAA